MHRTTNMKINMMDNDNIHVLKIFMINDRAAIDDNLPPTNYFDKKHFTIFLTGKYFAPQESFVFVFRGNVARIPRKNFVILMGLPPFYLDS